LGHLALAARPTAFPTQPLLTELLHRFELWTVLECHAVSHLARRDLHPVRTLLDELNEHLLEPTGPGNYLRLESDLHRTVAEQAGNPLLARMIQQMAVELEGMCRDDLEWPGRRPGTVWLLQCQHRKVLSCLEAGESEDAVRHTRAHLHLIRDQMLAALSQGVAR
jgi:DNA-binding GntR family transcriptional regulator